MGGPTLGQPVFQQPMAQQQPFHAMPAQPTFQPAPQFQPPIRPQAGPMPPAGLQQSRVPTNVEQAGQLTPPATFRMHAPEPTPPATPGRLTMPSPEEFGLPRASAPPTPSTPAPSAAADWNQLKARMDRLNLVGCHIDRLSQGNYRVIFLLPGSQGSQHVEAIALTEGQAVLMALDRAETLARK